MSSRFNYAHSGKSQDRVDWQLLSDHLEAVESLADARGALLGLGRTAALAGRLHDLGKYDPAFDRVLSGEKLWVDHSTAGGKVLLDQAPVSLKPVAELLAYAILGHHAGLPDKTADSDACMDRRIAGFSTVLSDAWRQHLPLDFEAAAKELVQLTRKEQDKAAFDLSVAARMVFSCLVDADFRDTEAFYAALEGRVPDRDWPTLPEELPRLRSAFESHMARFTKASEVNQLRAEVLASVRAQAVLPPGLFTLTVPTGGGKTLASLGFALDHAAQHGHRRIIYAIPYTSIIDQTATIFRQIFGDGIVLEHHGAIDEKQPGAERRDKLRLAMEDWAAPVIVTTNVQLFESLFASRPSRCRKNHNISGSVIILDEAQCLPRRLLLPTLAMIETLAQHYGCTVVLCTATQPAFDSRELKTGGLSLEGRELAPEPEALARKLKRVRILYGGGMDDSALIGALAANPQCFVIVNSRKHALDLYRLAAEAELEGLVHLTTRQYPAHRGRIIKDIKARLKAGAPCRLIATSLIEAGVDLDFPCAWRAEAGLDSVIQAAGRVNREGERSLEASTLTVFKAPENAPPGDVENLAAAMRRVAGKVGFAELLAPEAIRDWFEEVYWQAGTKLLDKHGLKQKFVFDGRGTDFAFRDVAAKYRMIDSPMVPVIVLAEPKARTEVARLSVPEVPSGVIARALQPYTVQIPESARETLRANGKGSFHATGLRGDQFFVLDDPSLYRTDFGLWWEQAEYLSADQANV